MGASRQTGKSIDTLFRRVSIEKSFFFMNMTNAWRREVWSLITTLTSSALRHPLMSLSEWPASPKRWRMLVLWGCGQYWPQAANLILPPCLGNRKPPNTGISWPDRHHGPLLPGLAAWWSDCLKALPWLTLAISVWRVLLVKTHLVVKALPGLLLPYTYRPSFCRPSQVHLYLQTLQNVYSLFYMSPNIFNVASARTFGGIPRLSCLQAFQRYSYMFLYLEHPWVWLTHGLLTLSCLYLVPFQKRRFKIARQSMPGALLAFPL